MALGDFGRVAERGVQERLSGLIDVEAAEALRGRVTDPAGRARLVSETGPGAAAWLLAAPLFQALAIEDECFRTALRTWLGLPYPQVAGLELCECGEAATGGDSGGAASVALWIGQ